MTDIAEFRGKSPDELKEEALKLKKELFNLRFQVATGEMQNSSRFRAVRRDIARIKTVMNEPKGGHLNPVRKEKVAKAPKEAQSSPKEAAPKQAKAKEAKEPKAKKAATKKKASGE